MEEAGPSSSPFSVLGRVTLPTLLRVVCQHWEWCPPTQGSRSKGPCWAHSSLTHDSSEWLRPKNAQLQTCSLLVTSP